MRVVVAVSGGIAAYKSCELVSQLVKADHEVRVVMTPAAAQFVAPLTFRALSGHAVGIHSDDEPEGPLSHVVLSHWAEVLIMAPASASLISRLAQGRAEDLASLVYLGFRGPVLMAPAMEAEMWSHPSTQRNVKVLREDGIHLVGPNEGRLASGLEGLGRMAEPWDILQALDEVRVPKDLDGLGILITAGPTWEHFDPVRVLTNPSTGLMGVTIANQAVGRGAQVVLVAGPGVSAPVDRRVVRENVVSAADMQDRVDAWTEKLDVVVAAAAVSDFRPAERLTAKAHKDDVELQWTMVKNPDIIATVARRYAGTKLLIGFAAETENPVEQGEAKRVRKQLDAVVANRVGDRAGFGMGTYQAWLVTTDGAEPLGESKAETAARLLDWIGTRR